VEEQVNMENFFEETKAGERWVILSDKDQKLPADLKVIGGEMRKTNDGKPLKVLCLKSPDGQQFVLSAWSRDVRKCVDEWGTNPMTWGFVSFVYDSARGRWMLLPSDPQPIKVEKIAE